MNIKPLRKSGTEGSVYDDKCAQSRERYAQNLTVLPISLFFPQILSVLEKSQEESLYANLRSTPQILSIRKTTTLRYELAG